LSEKQQSDKYFEREGIRGLFVLGLLAVVASIRVQSGNVNLGTEQNPLYVSGFLDIMLLLWSFYAFFMVLGLSEDIIGEKAASGFREMSAMYLYISFMILAAVSFIFAYSIYHTRILWALGFIPVLVVYSLIRNYKKIKKSLSFESGDFWKRAKSNLYQVLFSVFVVCFFLIIFGTCEELVIPSFVIGSISIVGFLIARAKVKKETAEKKS
jgi:hypothetical protein